MATLNLSINGASISNSYKSVLDSPPPAGASAASRTYGHWALFSVTAPLVSAFQQGLGKESTLKVESTGEGELQDLIDEFSDGRIQFAFVKVKDANTGLFKNALIGWCGEGVPERTKGYFSSHQAAVEKLLHGYHVQISARTESDLTPDGIVQKIADASGAKYSITDRTSQVSNEPPQPPPKKAVFTPVSGSNSGSSFNPLAARLARSSKPQDLDDDGWGADAPPVTRTQLETVKSAYIPTTVDMRQLANQPSQTSRAIPDEGIEATADVIKGNYKPIGKVDIAAIRKQAAESGHMKDERPSPVKGAYEPVGKVDIAAIRARAQPAASSSPVGSSAPRSINEEHEATSEQSSITANTGRLEHLPRPKVTNRFGSGSGAFGATRAPVPGQFGLSSGAPVSNAETVNTSRTFADSAGKTPAQLWAEKKAASNGGTVMPPTQDVKTIPAQSPGWKSGYEGKKWATVQTTRTGNSVTSDDQQAADSESEQLQAQDSQGLSSIRARFSQEPPPPNTLNATGTSDTGVHSSSREAPFKTEVPVEDLSARVVPPPVIPRTPSPDVDATDESSPVRIAMPIARGAGIPIQDARNEQHSPPPILPSNSLAQHAALQPGADEEPEVGHDTAREVAESVATAAFAGHQDEATRANSRTGNKRALAQYDYEKAEDNELELREGDEITNIDMIDADWWMGQNPRGETGLFPSNYVEIIEEAGSGEAAITAHEAAPSHGNIATAQYDYEAAEDNELSFPEGAKITNVEFPDDDWWSGEYNGIQGLFPANYVELDR